MPCALDIHAAKRETGTLFAGDAGRVHDDIRTIERTVQ
jgi:hypothetical protein